MDKILETYKDIQKAHKRSALYNLFALIIIFALIVAFSLSTLKMFRMAQHNDLILDYDGHVRTGVHVSRERANIIKAQAFIDDWAQHFFAFDHTNLHENLEYALELGDNSVKDAYLAFMSKNWYNDIYQNNLVQTCEFYEEPSIKLIDDYYSIVVNATIYIQDIVGSNEPLEYNLTFSCTAHPIKPSYPNFKQGLTIENFKYNITD